MSPPSRSLRDCCVCWMRRARACGQQSRPCTRGCLPSLTPTRLMASLSPPKTATETRRPKIKARPSPSATTPDRSVWSAEQCGVSNIKDRFKTLLLSHYILGTWYKELLSNNYVITESNVQFSVFVFHMNLSHYIWLWFLVPLKAAKVCNATSSAVHSQPTLLKKVINLILPLAK